MKKKSLFMALAALFVLAFASCNNEPEITGPGIDDGDDKPQPTEGIFSWEFSTSFGEFTTQDVLGAESWMIDFKTAKMTGYVDNTNKANEDWLISPAIKLENVTTAKLKMEYIARYFANLASDITVQVSENYSEGAPSTAQWTEVKPASALVSGADWTNFSTTEYSLTPYVGKTIRFAIKYVSNDTKAGTIEVKSVKVEEGEATGDGEPEIPTDVTGKGTKAEPYTANDVIVLNSTVIGPFFVKGYIVGQVNGMNMNESSVETAAPFTPSEGQTYNTNILIASNPDETNIKMMVPVQLPSGDLRTALNLPENEGMLKKEILLYGNLEKYFGAAGVKSPTYAVVDGTEYGSEPVIVDPDEQIYAESFAEGQGDFTIVDVLLPEGAQHIWYYNEQYKQMAASGYVNGASQNAESWLISPALDLSAKTSAIFTFEHAGKQFGAPVTNLTIQVSTTYNGGEINAADWTELTIPDHLAGETNTFKSAGDIDLSKYCGNSNVRIAFKYTSTTSGSGNWYVKNVIVRE